MAYEIFASGLNLALWTDYGPKQPQISPAMIRHIIEKWHNPSFEVRYRMILADTVARRYAAECTITANTPTPFETTRVGEVSPEEDVSHPIEEAYNRAFLKAAGDLLKLTVKSVEKSPNSHENAQEVQEVISDDEVILFGEFRGKKIGEVKGTPGFDHFLDQIRLAGPMQFPISPEKTEQYRKMLQLAKGGT